MIDLVGDWAWIKAKAEERRLSKLQSSATKSLADGDHDLIGFATERAWSRYSGQPMDDNVYRGGDAGFDTPDGFNVKGTKYRNGHLLHTVGDPWPPAGFILVYVDLLERLAVVQGWASNDDVRSVKPSKWPSGMCHAIHNTKLRQLDFATPPPDPTEETP